MGRPISPCKGCEKRKLHCHSQCAAYVAFAKETQEYRDATFAKKLCEFQAEALSVARSDRVNKALRRYKK